MNVPFPDKDKPYKSPSFKKRYDIVRLDKKIRKEFNADATDAGAIVNLIFTELKPPSLNDEDKISITPF